MRGGVLELDGGMTKRLGAAFTPTDPSDLVVWYDASQNNEADDTALASITDRSGNGRHLTQATGSFQPLLKTNIANGKPVYRFDGTDDFVSAAFALVHPVTLFTVFKQRSNPGSNRRAVDGNAGGRLALLIEGTSSVLYVFAGTGLNIGTIDTTNFHRVAAVFNGASSSGQLNAASAVSGDAGSDSSPGGVQWSRDGSTFAAVGIAEYFIYSRVLFASEIASARAYLKAKWGTA
jgi:hypothetical protein